MFGYVTVNSHMLKKPRLDEYQAYYCGVCHSLREVYGPLGRMTLTYDMTFLALLLDDTLGCKPESMHERCAPHMLRPHSFYSDANISYAADMNLLLAYYKQCDDLKDDDSIRAALAVRMLKNAKQAVCEKWQRQSADIAQSLSRLDEIEKRGLLNPDIPARCFGELMGSLFATGSPYDRQLRDFGSALGRFIYIMDACIDLKHDIRHECYNPMTAYSSADFYPMLTALMGECTRCYEALPHGERHDIIENILYAGIWTRYCVHYKIPAAESPAKGGNPDE